MTTYTAIPGTDIDQDSPITQPLMTLLRDNPISIAEADSTVPANLRPSVVLGTLDTSAGGTSVSLTSLDLTPYKWIVAIWDAVSFDPGGSSRSYSFGGATVTTSVLGSVSLTGGLIIGLTNGIGFSVLNSNSLGFNGTLSTASTSIAVSIDAASGATFDNGSIEVWGIK